MQPAAASPRISSTMTPGAWLRSRPRVVGTTQNVQCFSHPSITVTKALRRTRRAGAVGDLDQGALAGLEDRPAPLLDPRQQLADSRDRGGSEDQIHVGGALLDPSLLQLRHAAHHADDEIRAARA